MSRAYHYDAEKIAGVRRASRIAANTLEILESFVKPGITSEQIDQKCMQYIQSQGGRSGCKGYYGYPKNVCVSVNEVACHGIPSHEEVIQEGDIVNVDIVVEYEGFYGDTARMYLVGKASDRTRALVNATIKARDAGITAVRAGATLGDIGNAIETYATKAGYGLVRAYCGHGIGRKMHEAPQVLNYGNRGEGAELQAGMCITIEPILTTGSGEVRTLTDGTVVTCDSSWSAQCEHTVLVTDEGYEILSLSDIDCKSE